MSLDPAFIIGRDDRTRGGALTVANLNRVAAILLSGGFAVLPSDTAYSVAAVAMNGSIRTNINTMLRRSNMPVSQAFPSIAMVREWIGTTVEAERLIERYCPGPITVVCGASRRHPAYFFSEGVHGPDLTVGVRIPDSIVERDVAAATGYPITTVAIRNLEDQDIPVTDFDEALQVVVAGLEDVTEVEWCAIEGGGFYQAVSTVVRVNADGSLTRIRDGDIPFEEIEAVAAGQ